MNKFGKMRVIAAFTLALTMLASVAAPSFASAEGGKRYKKLRTAGG